MACHSPIFEQDLYRGGGEPHIYLLSHQLIGYAIVMAVNLDMIVDIDPGLFPFGVLIPARGKGFECGPVQGLKKVFSLWDTYVFADFVTYPSLWEGWGNQFLEAVRARLPIMIFEYPVFTTDIKEKGFKVISLGTVVSGKDQDGLVQVDNRKIKAAADQAVTMLTDPAVRKKLVDWNFKIGKEYYSMDALEAYLSPFIESKP